MVIRLFAESVLAVSLATLLTHTASSTIRGDVIAVVGIVIDVGSGMSNNNIIIIADGSTTTTDGTTATTTRTGTGCAVFWFGLAEVMKSRERGSHYVNVFYPQKFDFGILVGYSFVNVNVNVNVKASEKDFYLSFESRLQFKIDRMDREDRYLEYFHIRFLWPD